jgi:hypothetical protein
MGLLIGILSIISTAGVLYYMGKSGYDWGTNRDELQDDN